MRELTLDMDDPIDLPMTLEQIKSDLRISIDNLDELIMEQYLPDAIVFAERFMRRSIMVRTHRWILSDFPRSEDQVILLPRGKTQGVTSIVYSSAGADVTLTGPSSGSPGGSDYQEDLRGHRGRIMPNRGESWPSVDSDVPAPVTITFTAGWTLVSEVPAEIKRGLIARISDSLEEPGALDAVSRDREFPEQLLSGWRILA